MKIPTWGELKGIDFDSLGIVIAQSRAKGSLLDICEFYKSLELPIYLIFDTDPGDVSRKNTTQNHNLLNFVGATGEDFPLTKFETDYTVFSPNFEEVLRTIDHPNYEYCENLVNSELNLRPDRNKGTRAKYVVHKYEELAYPIPTPINELLDAIVAFSANH